MRWMLSGELTMKVPTAEIIDSPYYGVVLFPLDETTNPYSDVCKDIPLPATGYKRNGLDSA